MTKPIEIIVTQEELDKILDNLLNAVYDEEDKIIDDDEFDGELNFEHNV